MIKTYVKKPVIIRAIQYIANDNEPEVLDFCKGLALRFETLDSLIIRTLEGDMKVSDGDYVIEGIQGEFYPCKPDIFSATYEEVT